jgi:hypothetical protein
MEGWIVFTITGEHINPDLITRHLSIEPDRIVHPDERNGYKTLWQVNSRLSGDESSERHFQDILSRLLPVRDKVKNFSKEARIDFFCSFYKKQGSSETVVIPMKTLLLIGHLGANLEIDTQIR